MKDGLVWKLFWKSLSSFLMVFVSKASSTFATLQIHGNTSLCMSDTTAASQRTLYRN